MGNLRYNGWTNYATWRINLEILGDMEFSDDVTVDQLKDCVEEIVFHDYAIHTPQLAADYARAFLDNVNYHEIRDHINAELELQM